MKLSVIASALVLSSTMFVGHAMAADGIVHFTGEVIGAACEVTTDSKDLNVNMGIVSTTAFANGVGTLAAPEKFQIDLENCPDTVTKVAAQFDGIEAGDGYLAVNGGAAGVAIQIANASDNSVVKLYEDSEAITIDTNTHKATLPFIAHYISTDVKVTPGVANADSEFTLSYTK
ncbi:fimbrial protein [Salmonella enterica]|nr:fimbrial protein [Salmonella enterica subsp. enterica serovar Baguida]EKS4627085.1 fimbrial protein [Salmonella enterica]EKS4720126.1 fimbrial protein [Salmonella enterica]EKS4724582.1 fimbrial protein [Salmonella enterica]EKS4738311.1 fimbrial protein [Salmonella enterica]